MAELSARSEHTYPVAFYCWAVEYRYFLILLFENPLLSFHKREKERPGIGKTTMAIQLSKHTSCYSVNLFFPPAK